MNVILRFRFNCRPNVVHLMSLPDRCARYYSTVNMSKWISSSFPRSSYRSFFTAFSRSVRKLTSSVTQVLNRISSGPLITIGRGLIDA